MWKEREAAKVDGYGTVSCPECGDTYLHQSNVTIYEFADDPLWNRVFAQRGKEVVVTDFPRIDSPNPSRDRNGLTIEFACENCHGGDWNGEEVIASKREPFRLAIYQHKGVTYMEWVK
jgi:hypothetical protein